VYVCGCTGRLITITREYEQGYGSAAGKKRLIIFFGEQFIHKQTT